MDCYEWILFTRIVRRHLETFTLVSTSVTVVEATHQAMNGGEGALTR